MVLHSRVMASFKAVADSSDFCVAKSVDKT